MPRLEAKLTCRFPLRNVRCLKLPSLNRCSEAGADLNCGSLPMALIIDLAASKEIRSWNTWMTRMP